MTKQHLVLSLVLLVLALDKWVFSNATSQEKSRASKSVAYFQVSSSKNQLRPRRATSVTYDQLEGSNRITLVKGETFQFNRAGLYFGVFSAQIGSPHRIGSGEIHIWSKQGGQVVPDSNGLQTVEPGSTSVLIYPTIFQARAGDNFTIIYSSFPSKECGAVGLTASLSYREPFVPSIIASGIQLSGLSAPISYVGLASLETQLGDSTPKVVRLGISDQTNGIDSSTSNTDGTIRFEEAGVYFILASAQVGSVGNNGTNGAVHLWLKQNGKGIPNSNSIQSIINGGMAVLNVPIVIKVNANETLQVAFSSTNKNLGLIIVAPKDEPGSASLLFIAFRLDTAVSSIPYAQLSSLKSQWGCIEPRSVQLDSTDSAQGITNRNGTIVFREGGTYFLIAAAQVGSQNEQGNGDVHLWLRLNGQDLANSNSIQTVKGNTAVLNSQTVAILRRGDRIQVMFSTDVSDGTLGLVASQPNGEPFVSSLIFSAFKSDCSG